MALPARCAGCGVRVYLMWNPVAWWDELGPHDCKNGERF